jgi:hypothetical protein
VGQQADVAHRVAGCVQALQFHGFTDLDDVTGLYAAVDMGDAPARFVVRNHLGAGGSHHSRIAARVVGVFVGVE